MKKVLLLLAKGFELYEASVFTDVIGWNLIDGDGTTRLATCGLRTEVESSFGLKVITDFIAEEVIPIDYEALAVPGGFEQYGFYEDAYNDRFLGLIRAFHSCNKIIASVCVGALPIARSGILKGKYGTTYNMNNDVRQDQLRGYGVNVINEPVVIDGNIITS